MTGPSFLEAKKCYFQEPQYFTFHRFVLLHKKSMPSETMCIYGEMAKNHLCLTDVTKRCAKKCALLYNLGQKC